MSKIKSREFEDFNAAMDAILRADPKAVKEEMEREKMANKEQRMERGERKRGKHSDKHNS